MSTPKHREKSEATRAKLKGWGFDSEITERMGAFFVLWALFETNLETTIWALTNENVSGQRPSTDMTPVSKWIEILGHGTDRFSPEIRDSLKMGARAAQDLLEYRNSIAHGWAIPMETGPMFLRNPSWNGEIRKRPVGDAHLNNDLLDMAIDCAWVLSSLIFATREASHDLSKEASIRDLRLDVNRAARQASELRHLTALMKHEKN